MKKKIPGSVHKCYKYGVHLKIAVFNECSIKAKQHRLVLLFLHDIITITIILLLLQSIAISIVLCRQWLHDTLIR